MEYASNYTDQQQHDINLVCQYQGVTLVSDISNANGTEITHDALEGRKQHHRSTSHKWPRQPYVTKSQRKLWKVYLQENFISIGNTLKRSLGHWTKQPATTWRYHYDPLTEQLQDWHHKHTAKLLHSSGRDHRFAPWIPALPGTTWTFYPVDPPTVTENQVKVHRLPQEPCDFQNYGQAIDTYRAHVRNLPYYRQRLVNGVMIKASDAEIYAALRSRKPIYIISDGGLKDTRITYGWKIVDVHLRTLFAGSGPVDGPTMQSSSTRAELFGLGSPLAFLHEYCHYYRIPLRGRIRWYCDSQAAIGRVEMTLYPYSKRRSQPNNVDIVALIATEVKHHRRPFRCTWVKAHQDDQTPYSQLSPMAKLNVDVDRLATLQRKKSHRHQSRQKIDHYPMTNVSISIGGERLTGNFNETLRYHINGTYMRRYYCKRKGWSDYTYSCVDWHSFGKHMDKVPAADEPNYIKQLHDWLPLGHQRFYRSGSSEEGLLLCCACKTETETVDHMFTCYKKRSHRYQTLNKLKRNLQKKYHPAGAILHRCIEQWSKDQSAELDPDVNLYPKHLQPYIIRAMDNQKEIGWNQALRGFLSVHWRRLAEQDPIRPDVPHGDTGESRMVHILGCLRKYTRATWLHRNDLLHRKQQAKLLDIRTELDATIKHFLTRGTTLLRTDEHLLQWDLTNLLLQSRANKQRWLYRVKKARARAMKDTQSQTVLTSHSFSAPQRPTRRKPRPKHAKPTRHFHQQRLSNFTKKSVQPSQPSRPRRRPYDTPTTTSHNCTAIPTLFQPTLHFFQQRTRTPPIIFDPPD